MNCSKIKTVPNRISLMDNRCFAGACEECGELTYFCETVNKYRHCHCCDRKGKEAVKMYNVKLSYFKKNGKYYTEGSYKTVMPDMIKIINEVNSKRIVNELPGVCCADFIILIEVDAAFSYPHLLML